MRRAQRTNISISAGVNAPEDTTPHTGGPATIGAVAAFAEFGTAKVPPRPFLSTAFDVNVRKWKDQLTRAISAQVIDGAPDSTEAARAQIVQDIQGQIRAFDVIDTGLLHDSITAKVVK